LNDGYDPLNRLVHFNEGPNAIRNYAYDKWGNQCVSENSGLPLNPLTPSPMTTAGCAFQSNRLTTAGYDSRGNQTSFSPFTLAYDGSDLQKSVVSVSNGSASYEYDGEGRRVRKLTCSGSSPCTDNSSGLATTVYVYDAFGHLTAEYSASPSQNGRNYFTTDHLGSIRLVTDSTGSPLKRYDYIPFGEEIPSSVNNRSSLYPQVSGSADGQPQKFTGKERDAETGLDFFLARYYSGAQGRFLSPDEWKGGIVDPITGQDVETNTALPYADITDPQTLNKYAYVRNNPLRYTDPTGHCIEDLCIGEAILVYAAYTATAATSAYLLNRAVNETRAWLSSKEGGEHGSDNPSKSREPQQLVEGKAAHKNEEVRPGEKAEVRTPSGKGQMDRYNEEKAHIREIKPVGGGEKMVHFGGLDGAGRMVE
jgi:RHS repeat-associated protein